MSTEQEQEALVAAYLEEHGHHADARHGFLAGLDAGFRRTEVPEPSAEVFRRQIADERARQIEGGYDAEHDRAHGVDHILRWAQDYARRGRSVQSAALIEAAREMLREGAK